MTILLLGSGGREDALAWRLAQSPGCNRLIAAPGNPGIARWAQRVALDPCDVAGVVALAKAEAVDLVIVGPEAPLVAGVGDALRAAGIAVFGPNADAAQLEGSKGFTKDLCAANDILTAGYDRVTTVAEAMGALDDFAIPVVIKADGLAAGKGVTVAMTRDEAVDAITRAGDGEMVIEEFMEGEEASLFALVDGPHAVAFASAQDHKRVGEGEAARNAAMMAADPRPMRWAIAGRDQFALLLQSIGQAHRSRLHQHWLYRLVIAGDRLYPPNRRSSRFLRRTGGSEEQLPLLGKALAQRTV